jgi:hypothetical protein
LDADSANKLERALFHLKSALQLLDEAGAPPEIGAHADLSCGLLQRLLTGKELGES